jgi:hypothetical protein
MAQYGPSIQTAQVTTGNFRTTVDPYVTGYAGYPTNPGNRAIPGSAYYDSGGASSTATTATPFDNEFGRPGKYRYVRYYDSAATALTNLTAPAPVYWVDANYTTVTPVYSQSLTGGINCLAGLLMVNTTDLPSLVIANPTATQTQLNGNFVWICVAGYVAGAIGATSTAADDAVIGSTTTFTPGRTVANTAPTNRVLGWAMSALNTPATGQINLLVTLES